MTDIRDIRHLAREQGSKPPPVVVDVGKNQGVLVVFKAASRSIVSVGKKADPRKGRLPKDIHVFVRDPHERLVSGYNFFKGMKEKKKGKPKKERPVPRAAIPDTWEEYVDNVLSGAYNPHWEPVSQIIERFGKPVIIHQFEDIQREFPNGIKLPRKNESTPAVVDNGYRYDDILEFYAADYVLRNP